MIAKICEDLDSDNYTLYLSPQGGSFRHELYSDYKGNRTAPKPIHYDFLRTYLIKELYARVASNEEADDLIGRVCTRDTTNHLIGINSNRIPDIDLPIIASIDKDLDQIPGWHYNFVKEKKYEVSEAEGLQYFYQQVLTGDRADNIPGLPGIGPVKAQKALREAPEQTELGWYQAVRKLYQRRYPKQWKQALELTANLCWIKKYEREEWHPPNGPTLT